MGLYDRDYVRESYRSHYRPGPPMRFGFPKVTPIVKRLLIINIAIFFAGAIFFPNDIPARIGQHTIPVSLLEKWFSVFPNSLSSMLQLWRLITYQFLHGGLFHIFFNMLVLYFLGPTLEHHWGSKRFLIFYLICGAAGGLFYTFLVAVNFLPPYPMIGASGAILGVLAACAILFPHFSLFIFPFFFPVPIRVAALAFVAIYIFAVITRSTNAGGHAAHLAGMAAAAIYIFYPAWRAKLKIKIRSSRWEKKITQQRKLQAELDRILQKVHESGIHSLTPKEKKTLKKATEAERTQNKLL